MLRLVTVCRPAKASNFYSGHPDVCSAIIIIIIIVMMTTKAILYTTITEYRHTYVKDALEANEWLIKAEQVNEHNLNRRSITS